MPQKKNSIMLWWSFVTLFTLLPDTEKINQRVKMEQVAQRKAFKVAFCSCFEATDLGFEVPVSTYKVQSSAYAHKNQGGRIESSNLESRAWTEERFWGTRGFQESPHCLARRHCVNQREIKGQYMSHAFEEERRGWWQTEGEKKKKVCWIFHLALQKEGRAPRGQRLTRYSKYRRRHFSSWPRAALLCTQPLWKSVCVRKLPRGGHDVTTRHSYVKNSCEERRTLAHFLAQCSHRSKIGAGRLCMRESEQPNTEKKQSESLWGDNPREGLNCFLKPFMVESIPSQNVILGVGRGNKHRLRRNYRPVVSINVSWIEDFTVIYIYLFEVFKERSSSWNIEFELPAKNTFFHWILLTFGQRNLKSTTGWGRSSPTWDICALCDITKGRYHNSY